MTEQPTSAYPLTWPIGWKRTDPFERKTAKFNTKGQRSTSFGTYTTSKRITVAVAVDRVVESLIKMRVDYDDIIISTDLVVRLDGLPRSNQREPDDAGVAVYWTTPEGEQRCMAIDRYDRIADNIAAVAATLEALRAIERHGGGEILDRAFTGFKALPNPADEPWWSILDYHSEEDALANDFEKRARQRMSLVHPDSGTGDDWLFDRIKKALDKGRDAARAAK